MFQLLKRSLIRPLTTKVPTTTTSSSLLTSITSNNFIPQLKYFSSQRQKYTRKHDYIRSAQNRVPLKPKSSKSTPSINPATQRQQNPATQRQQQHVSKPSKSTKETPITPTTSLQQLFQKEKQAANRKRQKHKHLHERKKQQALERQRNERYLLNELLNHGDTRQAWRLFYDRLESGGTVTTNECCSMCMSCHTSEEMWTLINETMKYAKIKPNVFIMNIYITMLRLEGKYDEAILAVDKDMKQLGIEPNHKIKEMLKMPEEILSNMRGGRFAKYLNAKGRDGLKSYWNLINKLIEKNLAQTHQFNPLLKYAHNSTYKKRTLFRKM